MADVSVGTAVRTYELTAQGIRTRVLEAGPPDRAEAVVLLHGAPASANEWDDLLPRIGAFARAVAFDMPGFGHADKPVEWDYSPNAWATFIAAALQRLGVTRAHLIMNDIGGAGIFWGAAHPDQFASAVLIDSGVGVGLRRWHAVGELFRTPVLGRLAERSGRLGFGAVMRFYNRGARPIPGAVLRQWRADYDFGSRHALMRFYRSTPPAAFARIIAALRPLDVPALVVWGAHDRFLRVNQAERQREAFPSAQVVVLSDSAHYPPLDDPHAVAAAVVPFLRAQLGGPAAASPDR